MDEAQLKSLLETLADLSLDGKTFQICHAALRLQAFDPEVIAKGHEFFAD